jgi:hypothetical protein
VTIRTRTGLDWTKRFPAIAAAFDIPVDRAIFYGEVVVVKDGRTNFSELQAALAAGRQEALTFNAFDLLFLEGFDLRDSPLSERKRREWIHPRGRSRRPMLASTPPNRHRSARLEAQKDYASTPTIGNARSSWFPFHSPGAMEAG